MKDKSNHMSIVESFHLMPAADLPGLLESAAAPPIIVKKGFFKRKQIIYPYNDYLVERTRKLKGLVRYSASLFLDLMYYLAGEHQFDLDAIGREPLSKELSDLTGLSEIILTYAHRLQFDNLPDPETIPLQELKPYQETYPQDEDCARGIIEAWKVLRDNIREITDDSRVVLFYVG